MNQITNEAVTCRKCGTTYVPDFMNDFYPDGDDPNVGRCERCMMSEAFAVNTKDPHPLPSGHLESICKPAQGTAVCSFLIAGRGGFGCAKDSQFESIIRQRLAEGTMKAKGDNCSGSPNFTPTVT